MFTIIILVSFIYLLSSELINNKIDKFLILSSLTFFIDNNKNLIYVGIFIFFVMIFVSRKNIVSNQIRYVLLIILFLDISLVYFQNTNSGDINQIIEECRIELKSDSCLSSYLSS